MEFGGRLDRYLCDGAEEAMFGDGRYECQMCGKEISECDAEENYGLCENCLCDIDNHACDLCGAPVDLILDRLKEYLGEYEITIVKRES